jgi:NodT family efflux transporter outer membrane factor (OMF) lipoprotein
VGFSVPVTYEVDLFGRYASSHRSARLDAAATERDAEAVAISISAQTAEAYFDLVEVRARRALLTAQVATNASYLELVTFRFERGLTSAVDVHQQRQLVAGTEAQLSLVAGEEAVVENQLAVLVGVPPGRTFAEGEATLPELPAAPAVGAPAELLARRPDLLAADLRLRAADARVASAVRATLPALQLSFTPGYTIARTTFSNGAASEFLNQDIVRGYSWSAGGTLNVPLFDGLVGVAVTRERRAQVDEALANYRDAYLAALVEVENAVALERQQRENIAHLEQQVEYAGATLEATQGRYRAGLSDYLPVLTALRTEQEAQLRLLAARRQLVSHRLQLYRALGAAIDVESEIESR